MRFQAYHGVTDREKELGGQFEIDCEYGINFNKAAQIDSLENIVDYSAIYQTIENLVTQNRFNLVETLARHLADKLFESFRLEWLIIRVRKLNPPMPGNIDSFEVEIGRPK